MPIAKAVRLRRHSQLGVGSGVLPGMPARAGDPACRFLRQWRFLLH